jgi:hypothetical protein
VHEVSRGNTSVIMGIVISPAAATDGACRRVVIMMSGSDFMRFRAASCHGWIAGNHREQNDRHNPHSHRPSPFAENHTRMILDLASSKQDLQAGKTTTQPRRHQSLASCNVITLH